MCKDCYFYENGKCLACKRYYELQACPDCASVKDCYYKQLESSSEEYEKKIAQLDAENSLYEECISQIEDYFDLEPAPALRLSTLLGYLEKVSKQVKGTTDG